MLVLAYIALWLGPACIYPALAIHQLSRDAYDVSFFIFVSQQPLARGTAIVLTLKGKAEMYKIQVICTNSHGYLCLGTDMSMMQ